MLADERLSRPAPPAWPLLRWGSLLMSPWTRDGHLHELGAMQALAGELDAATQAAIDVHLRQCPACKAAYDQSALAWEAPLPARVRPPPPPAWRRLAQHAALPLVALAAVGLLVTLPQREPTEVFTARGGALNLEVYRNDGHVARVVSGDHVREGDRLGFRVATDLAGHLIVLGLDSAGEVYPVWPQPPERGTVPVAASPAPVPLDGAIVLDNTPGEERLLALLCPTPRTWEDLARRAEAQDPAAAAPLGLLDHGCAQTEVRLIKDTSETP